MIKTTVQKVNWHVVALLGWGLIFAASATSHEVQTNTTSYSTFQTDNIKATSTND